MCEHANAGSLAVDASLPTLQITSRADAAGAMRNEACTGASLPGLGAPGQARPPIEGDPNAANDCVTATATSTTVRPDLAISKTTSTPTGADKTVGTSEDRVTYTRVARIASGSDGATGVRITDAVPGFIAGRSTFGAFNPVVSAGNATFSCSGSANGTVTCNQTAGTLAPGQTVTVPVVVLRPLRDGSFTNTASVTNTAEGDPDAINNSAQDTVVIAPIADVAMTGKTVTPASVRAGQNATYVLSYANNGPSTAADAVVTDTFNFANGADTGFTVVSITSSRSGSTCSIAAGAQITPAAPALSCSIGTLADGQAESITLVLRPNFMAGNPARTVGNTAAITTSSVEHPTGGDNGNNSRTATLAITAAQLDLLVNKTDLVDPVPFYNVGEGPEAGTFLKYQVLVSNTGPSYGTGVKITEVMTPPASPARTVRFVCDTTTDGGSTCNSPPLCTVANVDSASGQPLAAFTCDVPAGNATTGLARGDLAAGQSKPIWLRFQALDQPQATGDVFRNTATASANEPDSNPANNSATEPTTTRQRVDLRVTKTASLAAVAVNQPFTWTVTVVNNGPGVSLQTDLADTLPVGAEATGLVTFTRTSPAGSGTRTVTGRSIACALGQLNANAGAVISVPARFTSVPSGGTGTNTATLDTDPAKTGGIDTPGGFNTATNTVAVTAASLAGTVYQDTGTGIAAQADNGVKDAGEVGIGNVPITVTGTDVAGNPVNRSTVSDASGNWRIDGLLAADASGYTVTEGVIPPASGSFIDGRETAGTAAGNGTAVNDRISAVALAAGQQATGYLFGELGIAPISGTVYSDLNRNGTLDAQPTDGRITGVVLNLVRGTDCSATPVASTSTDAAGNYSFSGAGVGLAYTLCEVQPAGYLQGSETAGTGNTGSTNAIHIPSLAVTGSTGNHFGEIASNSVIAGRVWLDADNSGSIEASENGIAGVTLTLSGTDSAGNAVSRSTTTAADGSWRFEALPPGTYTVTEPTQPSGTLNGRTVPGSIAGTATGSATTPGTTSSVISGIVLGLSQSSLDNNFGELPPALLAGRVYADNNDNGAIDTGETGLAGVVITLTGSDDTGATVTRSATTGADGSDAFTDLRPGSYTLTEPVQPGGTVNGRTTAGNLGGTATTPATTTSAITAITVAPGGQGSGYNFGEIGHSPDLRVATAHTPATVTVNNRFPATLVVRNAGELPTSGSYTVSDRLPAGLTLAGPPAGTGWTCTGAAGDTAFSCSSSAVLAAGATAPAIDLSLRVAADALARSPLQNLALVEGGGELAARLPGDAERAAFNAGHADALPLCDAAVLHNVCRDPAVVQASASVAGTAWFESGSVARQLDAGDRRLPGWTVEVVNAAGTVVGSAVTAADGTWQVSDLVPGVPLQVRYRHPQTGVAFGYPVNGDTGPGSSGASCDANAAANGTASSCAHTSGQPVLDIVLAPGRLLPQQSLPLGVDPAASR